MAIYLSKSKYCLGVRCPKMLWLDTHCPDKFDNSKIPETGNAFGALARELFSPYTLVEKDTPQRMLEVTARLMDRGTAHIAEASFSWEGLFCSVDILKNLGGGRMAIYEVKSNKDIKPIHLQDVAYQHYVLTRLGYRVEQVTIVHVNGDYTRCGDLELDKLFALKDVTGQVRAMFDEVARQIDKMAPYLVQTEEPAVQPEKRCFSPKPCGFFSHCFRDLPSPNVFDLSGTHTKTTDKLALYRQGIISFPQLYAHAELKAPAMTHVRHEVEDLPPEIDRKALAEDMKEWVLPLYFLDFETYTTPIPPFDNSFPNEIIPFQYSLHFVAAEGQEAEHREHLAETGTDPRRPLAEQLCRDIPRDAIVIAYHASVEAGVVRRLAELYGDLADHLNDIADNIKDLEEPFRKMHYYTRKMAGSSSIKAVLPALYPDDPALDYHALEGVHNGAEAYEAFLTLDSLSRTDAEAMRENLKKYCKLDTLAMVKLWERLQETQ